MTTEPTVKRSRPVTRALFVPIISVILFLMLLYLQVVAFIKQFRHMHK